MKLSLKFFCIAYIVVLLSTGLGGAYIINSVNNTLWDTQVDRVNTAVNYAADSFLSFLDISYSDIADTQQTYILRQIENTLDTAVTDIKMGAPETMATAYATMEDNRCASRFVEKEDRLLMESVCKLSTGTQTYYLTVYGDFTAIREQCALFWERYGIVVFSVSAIGGLLLLALSGRVTKPLCQLAKATDEIAVGNYGKKVDVHSKDQEIAALSDSFNAMSMAVERNIREIQAEAEKRNRFMADFTHEIKTPMTAIIGYAQMLRSYELEAGEKDTAVEAIHKEAKRLEKLSLQLLELYVFQNEAVELERVSLLSVAEQLKTTLAFLSEKYGVFLPVSLDDAWVWANEVLLLSLLYNLADNAFKASAPGATVSVYSRVSTEHIHILVQDRGRGIAKENMELLTEPFYREDKSRSRKLGGAGLGLSLCKEIAALHDTELMFESELGEGTTVTITLKRGGEDHA